MLEICISINIVLLIAIYFIHRNTQQWHRLVRWGLFILYLGLNIYPVHHFSPEIQFAIFFFVLVWALKWTRLLGSKTKLNIFKYLFFVFVFPSTNPQILEEKIQTDNSAAKFITRGIFFYVLMSLFFILTALTSTPLLIVTFLSAAFFFDLMANTDILVGISRLLGYKAEPVFVNPFISTSLAEFWGKRWNTVVHEFIKTEIYFPTIKLGHLTSSFFGFFFSGLIHELILTVPVNSHFGMPTCYFLIQWLGLVIERPLKKVLRRKITGWLWTATFLVLPLPLFVNPSMYDSLIILGKSLGKLVSF